MIKNTTISLLAACLLAWAGCSEQPATDSQKSAIQSVLTQRAKLKADDQHSGLMEEQLKGLMAIDVRPCPSDFRAAWFDYLVEADKLRIRMKRVATLAEGEGKTVQDTASLIKFAGANAGLSQYLISQLDKVDDAWGRVERSAMDYGVMPGQ